MVRWPDFGLPMGSRRAEPPARGNRLFSSFSRRFQDLVVLGSAALAFCVYMATMAPDLTWAHWGADGGDFITAAVTGRVPHSPGFPLYMLLADWFVRLPLGDSPAWRLNLLSALMAAGSTVGLALALLRSGKSPIVALAAALSLACAPLFWSQAVITEVYTTAAFFSAWTLYLWVKVERSQLSDPVSGAESTREAYTCSDALSPRLGGVLDTLFVLKRPCVCAPVRLWFMAGLLWGLGMAVHPTLIFLAPLWVRARGRTLGALALGVLGGLLPYAFFLLCGPWPQPWGDLRTVSGWLEYVSARLYWGYAFGLPLSDWPRRLLSWAALMARQFTPLGAPVLLLGFRELGGRSRHVGWGLLLALGLDTLYALGYDSVDSLVYLVPFLPLWTWGLGEGMAWMGRRGIPPAVWLLVPLLSVLWNGPMISLREDTSAREWAEQVMAQAPPESVLVTHQDGHTFALWYAQEGLGLRPDVWVVDADLWATEPYRAWWSSRTGREVEEIAALAGDRTLCDVTDEGLACSVGATHFPKCVAP